MYKKGILSLCITLSLFLLSHSDTLAHPGRTDSSGCHTCKTNCGNWGLSYGEYHCHGSKPQVQVYPTAAPTRKPTAIITKPVVKKQVTKTVKNVTPTISKKSGKGANVKKKPTATVKKVTPTTTKKSVKGATIKKNPTSTPKPKYTCNCSKTCPNLSCDEAYFQLIQCGCSQRDGDNDGVPCEAQCR